MDVHWIAAAPSHPSRTMKAENTKRCSGSWQRKANMDENTFRRNPNSGEVLDNVNNLHKTLHLLRQDARGVPAKTLKRVAASCCSRPGKSSEKTGGKPKEKIFRKTFMLWVTRSKREFRNVWVKAPPRWLANLLLMVYHLHKMTALSAILHSFNLSGGV